VRDTLYGVPWYVDTRLLFYRADLLRAAGYDSIPTTWRGWRDAMVALKARMGPRAHPILLPTNEWPQPVILGMQTGGTLLRDGGQFGAFSDAAFRRGFEFYAALFRDSLAPVRSASEIANRYQEFERGNIAMVITGPWEIGEFSRRLPAALQDAWRTAALPGPEGPGASIAGGASLVVFRRAEHKREAWQLVEYLSRPDIQLRFYELTGNLPPRRTAWRDTTLATNIHARAFRDQLERVRPLPAVPEVEEIVLRVAEAGDRVARGQQSISDALARLDREVDRLLEKRRWMLARRSLAPAGAGGVP
jgi:multiple sugar transport system substrate-binding protein